MATGECHIMASDDRMQSRSKRILSRGSSWYGVVLGDLDTLLTLMLVFLNRKKENSSRNTLEISSMR